MQQRGKLCTLGAGVSLNMEFGIDLIHILLDAALGEIEFFRDLAVTQPLRYQLHDLKFPRRQRVKGRWVSACRVSRLCPFAKHGDLRRGFRKS